MARSSQSVMHAGSEGAAGRGLVDIYGEAAASNVGRSTSGQPQSTGDAQEDKEIDPDWYGRKGSVEIYGEAAASKPQPTGDIGATDEVVWRRTTERLIQTDMRVVPQGTAGRGLVDIYGEAAVSNVRRQHSAQPQPVGDVGATDGVAYRRMMKRSSQSVTRVVPEGAAEVYGGQLVATVCWVKLDDLREGSVGMGDGAVLAGVG
ncbi:hypothetical protein CALCODRAFT_510521 [Calocera cornea HHB12733]|uniref:Uncharacterized protein n=1 Tax=Calocera cornea HHB12733 TaxID=1353952 RepID=A0A165EFU8_9BASI|nr:hypothetical protein CALCODRAFT_510521 [Calocera cornea HHB12733]